MHSDHFLSAEAVCTAGRCLQARGGEVGVSWQHVRWAAAGDGEADGHHAVASTMRQTWYKAPMSVFRFMLKCLLLFLFTKEEVEVLAGYTQLPLVTQSASSWAKILTPICWP